MTAASGRNKLDRCQWQKKGERLSVRYKGCERERNSAPISNRVQEGERLSVRYKRCERERNSAPISNRVQEGERLSVRYK